MEQAAIIIDKISFLGLIVLVGFLALKLKYVKESIRDGLSALLMRFTVPCLILSTFSSMDMDLAKLKSGGIVILISYLLIGLFFLIGAGAARLLRLQGTTRLAHSFLSACGNAVFLGYPVISAIFGKEGLYFAMLYALANDSILWTMAVFTLAKGGKRKEPLLWKVLNPTAIALIAGVVIMVTGFAFPPLIQSMLTDVGAVTTPVSMLFIGLTLGTIRFAELRQVWKSFFIVFVKMLVIPICLIFLFSGIQGWVGVPAVGLCTIILQCAMPSPSIYAVLAKEYGGDVSYATECILVTTLCSFFTLPFIYYLIQSLGLFL